MLHHDALIKTDAQDLALRFLTDKRGLFDSLRVAGQTCGQNAGSRPVHEVLVARTGVGNVAVVRLVGLFLRIHAAGRIQYQQDIGVESVCSRTRGYQQ